MTQEGLDREVYSLSRHAVFIPLDGEFFFASHGVLGYRRILHVSAVKLLEKFATPRPWSEGVKLCVAETILPPPPVPGDPTWTGQLQEFLGQQVKGGFLVRAGVDEMAELTELVRRKWSRDVVDHKQSAVAAVADMFEPAQASTPIFHSAPGVTGSVSFLLLGWCLTQSVKPLLEEMARARGLDASVTVGFHDDLHLVPEVNPDVVVVQLSHRMVLAPLLDPFLVLSQGERMARVHQGCALVRHAVTRAREVAGTRLLLVQGIATPQTSSLGMLEYRSFPGMFDAVAALNVAAREAMGNATNVLFIDEEAVVSRSGKRQILDDTVSTYSHHGTVGFDPEGGFAEDRVASFHLADRLALHRLLAGTYLDHYQAWLGTDTIRCICVDLDNTLWPGEIADDGFTFTSDDLGVALMYGRHGGLHQALQIMKHRGILLAVVSRNQEEVVLRKWCPQNVPVLWNTAAEDARHYLGPQDFVRMKIGWGSKSQAIRELAVELGITFKQVAFIDDHPVEREEVRQALPEVMVLGEDMNLVREVLLTHPRFQVLDQTGEGAQRTETTRARLMREDAQRAAPDHASFLQSLQVVCTVREEKDATRAQRISELLRRTNQFNTTGLRLTVPEVGALVQEPNAHVITMEVRDRFAEYGLTGVAIVRGSELSACAMSCRVLGLEAERVLLRRAMQAAQPHGAVVHVPLVKTERNGPALRLFTVEGFECVQDGSGYRYSLAAHGLPPDPAHCRVEEG